VILEKISSAAIFVGDVTLIGKATMERSFLARLFRRFSNRQKNLDNPKMLPNPNVLLELGYAAHCLGWERVILVMNSHFGPPEFLPFDLRHRRFPISYHLRTVPYHLSPKSEGKSSVRSKLVGDLATQLRRCSQKIILWPNAFFGKWTVTVWDFFASSGTTGFFQTIMVIIRR
jgi:hypothetical protein